MAERSSNDLYGLVDMGSNGIRYSITDLSPLTARCLPTLFQDRLGVSLYDAQYETGAKGPISQAVIDQVLASLRKFKAACADFDVPDGNVKILATEATRTADNAKDYIEQVERATGGWQVDLLPKESEGRIGACGIASSFAEVEGLVMDLGGGSTQITWMVAKDGKVETSPKGSFSFPYGAAALTRQLADMSAQKDHRKARSDLKATMTRQFQDAFEELELPESLRRQARQSALTLYLSGGGFRGWGYLLMSQHKNRPYPVPIINGLHVPVKDFEDTDKLQDVVAEGSSDIFRVSKRRAKQVPAVAFLVNALVKALPFIADIRFCQGGVREGFFFDALPPEIRASDPLISATSRYSKDRESTEKIADLFFSALPDGNDLGRSLPSSIRARSTLCSLANLMYVHSSSSKESASLSALHLPITGVLSAAHGISHDDRALLALMLCYRWGGELAPPHENLQARLQVLLTQQEVWWGRYVGAIAKVVGDVYPAGRVARGERRVCLEAKWSDGVGKKGNKQGVVLTMRLDKDDAMINDDLVRDAVDTIEEVGKKKNRAGGKEHGFGLPVQVDLV